MNKNLILAGSIILAIILLGGCAEKMPQERVEAPETQPPPISEDSQKEGKIGGLDKILLINANKAQVVTITEAMIPYLLVEVN